MHVHMIVLILCSFFIWFVFASIANTNLYSFEKKFDNFNGAWGHLVGSNNFYALFFWMTFILGGLGTIYYGARRSLEPGNREILQEMTYVKSRGTSEYDICPRIDRSGSQDSVNSVQDPDGTLELMKHRANGRQKPRSGSRSAALEGV